MKKHLILCIALVALMASCVKEPTIYRRLLDEDAAAIPYQKGQTAKFINQDGDTLLCRVAYDDIQLFSEDTWEYPYDSKMSIIRQPWCYARTVLLRGSANSTFEEMMFTVIPDKHLYFRWNYEMSLPSINLNEMTETVEVNGVTYENVHIKYSNTQSGELNFLWYYSEEVGLIAVKYKDHSLTLVP